MTKMVNLACEQAPQGTLVVGQEKEGELATSSLEFVVQKSLEKFAFYV